MKQISRLRDPCGLSNSGKPYYAISQPPSASDFSRCGRPLRACTLRESVGGGHAQKMGTVMHQLINGLVHVGQCGVRLLLLKQLEDFGGASVLRAL